MFEMFATLDPMHQVYWTLAIISSLVFVAQAVMIVIGFDADSDFGGGDADFDTDGFHIISVKTIVCFVLGFSWTGALFYHLVDSSLVLGCIAGGVGLLFMLLIALMFRQVMRLDKDNTFRAERTIGSAADVYLRIPAGRSETGKVTVSIHGSLHELEALTEGDEIPTGAKVRITGVVEGDVVLVEKI